MCTPEVHPTSVEVLNQDGFAEVFIHCDNVPGPSSVALPNGTQLTVQEEEGDLSLYTCGGLFWQRKSCLSIEFTWLCCLNFDYGLVCLDLVLIS